MRVGMLRRSAVAVAIIVGSGLVLACQDAVAPPASPTPPATAPVLASPLQSGCFGWPAAEFSPGNAATVQTLVRARDRAFEFTLADIDGRAYTLSALLVTRPVLVTTGSYT